MIRAFAPYSRSLYFNDNVRERGLVAELVCDRETSSVAERAGPWAAGCEAQIPRPAAVTVRPLLVRAGDLDVQYDAAQEFLSAGAGVLPTAPPAP